MKGQRDFQPFSPKNEMAEDANPLLLACSPSHVALIEMKPEDVLGKKGK